MLIQRALYTRLFQTVFGSNLVYKELIDDEWCYLDPNKLLGETCFEFSEEEDDKVEKTLKVPITYQDKTDKIISGVVSTTDLPNEDDLEKKTCDFQIFNYLSIKYWKNLKLFFQFMTKKFTIQM